MTKPVFDAGRFRGAARLALSIAGLRMAMEFVSPSTISRTYLEHALALVFVLAIARAGGVVVDMIAERWHVRLDSRAQAVTFSVLPLGKQIVKLALYLVAILGALSAWGYNTTTIVAGLGVGGLAIALAAQKTIENLFGGISVIGDRPVLVGDVCHFGDRTGTVMHIGLRSTSIRTPERTIVSVPNAQFSSMTLENISGRDKILFNPKVNLRRDTTSDQLLDVLATLREILTTHPKVEVGAIPVRFVGVGPYSLDIEIACYVTTSNYDEFLNLQQELLIRMLQAVEAAGAALAVPLQESFQPRKSD
jgi:MscS family membrane protein